MKPGLYGVILLGTGVMTTLAFAMPVAADSRFGPSNPEPPLSQTAYVQTPDVKKKGSAEEYFSQAPAPGSYGLFGTGLLGLAFIRHRREP